MIKVGTVDRISSHSVGQNNCVSVSVPDTRCVVVADTKVPGPALRVTPEAFSALLRGVR